MQLEKRGTLYIALLYCLNKQDGVIWHQDGVQAYGRADTTSFYTYNKEIDNALNTEILS